MNIMRLQYLGNSDTYHLTDPATDPKAVGFVAYGEPVEVDDATAERLLALIDHPTHPHRFARVTKAEPAAPVAASLEPSPPAHLASDPSMVPTAQ